MSLDEIGFIITEPVFYFFLQIDLCLFDSFIFDMFLETSGSVPKIPENH